MKEKGQQRSITDMLQEHSDRINREQPVIRSRYYGVEITPDKPTPWHDDSGRDWIPGKVRRVTGYYDTKEEVWAFLEKFEPDDGNTFGIRKQNLRQRQEWVNY